MYCGNCKYLHKSSTVTVSETNVVITFVDSPTGIENEKKFCFIICQDIPSDGNALAVQLTVNGAAVPLWDKYGNPVPGCGLTKGQMYTGYFGTGTANHIISSGLPSKCVCKSYAYTIGA